MTNSIIKIEALKIAISRTKRGVTRINDVVRDVNTVWTDAPLPYGEYKRRTWLLADLERMLAQMIDEAHAEALEEYDARNTLYVYAPGDAAREVWDQMTLVEQTVSVELRHAEALEMNRLFNMRAASDDRPQRLAKETGFPVLTCLKELIAEEGDYFAALERLRQIFSDSHSEALEENYRFGWLTNRFNLFWGGCDFSTRRSMTERAHNEALVINAEMAQREMKLNAIWRGTHRDYKSSTNGVRSILVCRGATCLVPLSGLTDKEINQRSNLWK